MKQYALCCEERCIFVFASLGLTAQTQNVDSYARLRELFPNPPAEYSTMPFFVWNGEVTEAKIDKFLADFHAQGVRGFFIHPRPGLITPYLSDRWFELVRYTVDKAKKLGMEVWLYDENSYPSGFAGGHVPARDARILQPGAGSRAAASSISRDRAARRSARSGPSARRQAPTASS